LHLDARLLAHPLDRRGGRAVERRIERQRSRRKAHDGVDLASGERLALAARDPGHQREVIVVAAPLHAQLGPAADVAVVDRLGIRALGRVGR
jgi:hypothetical protein